MWAAIFPEEGTHRFTNYSLVGLKSRDIIAAQLRTLPSAIPNPAHTQSISAAPFATPNTDFHA